MAELNRNKTYVDLFQFLRARFDNSVSSLIRLVCVNIALLLLLLLLLSYYYRNIIDFFFHGEDVYGLDRRL